MRILIDADGCPVVNIAVDTAKKHNIECIILCDTSHMIERDGAKTVTVSKGADSVDFALVNNIQKGDIAITQDYGLAAMCLARNATVINQDGMVYSDDNIGALLNARYNSKKIRSAGIRIKGPAKRTSAQDECFRIKLSGLLADNSHIFR